MKKASKKPAAKKAAKQTKTVVKKATKKPKQVKATGKTTSVNGIVVVSHEKEAPEKTIEKDSSPVAKPFRMKSKKGKFVREDDESNDTMVKMEDFKDDTDKSLN